MKMTVHLCQEKMKWCFLSMLPFSLVTSSSALFNGRLQDQRCRSVGGHCIDYREYLYGMNPSKMIGHNLCDSSSDVCSTKQLAQNIKNKVNVPSTKCYESMGGFCFDKRRKDLCPPNYKIYNEFCNNSQDGCCVQQSSCRCGQPNNIRKKRITGGQDLFPANRYPWMIGLKKLKSSGLFSDGYFCGGALISDRYVLTAAHCMTHKNSRLQRPTCLVWVGIGDHKQYSTSDDVTGVTKLLPIDTIIIHENYDKNDTKKGHDIALLRLKEPLDLSSYNDIQPICLPKHRDISYEGLNGIIAGWGYQVYNSSDSKPDVIQELSLPILGPDCGGRISGDKSNMLMCTGFPSSGGVNPCRGDSGGPLIIQEKGIYTQVGIVSYGPRICKRASSNFHTRTAHYLDWIAENTKDSRICIY